MNQPVCLMSIRPQHLDTFLKTALCYFHIPLLLMFCCSCELSLCRQTSARNGTRQTETVLHRHAAILHVLHVVYGVKTMLFVYLGFKKNLSSLFTYLFTFADTKMFCYIFIITV